MMDIYVMPRASGKTTMLIHKSHDTQIPILVSDLRRAKYVEELAKNLGIDIPEPLTVGSNRVWHCRSVLVDDLDSVVGAMFRTLGFTPIEATMSTNHELDVHFMTEYLKEDYDIWKKTRWRK